MKKSILFRTILIILLVLWAAFIFIMSSQPATESSNTSSVFVLKIIDIFYRDFEILSTQKQESITHIITFIVRKFAHFSEYFILGLLSTGVAITYNSKKTHFNFILAALFSVVYAISDEVHQYFVPGRACRFLDICIDSVGSICAVVCVMLFVNFKKRRKAGEFDAEKEIN